MMASGRRVFIACIALLTVCTAGALFYRTPDGSTPTITTAQFGSMSLRLDLATTSSARAKGLAGRTILAPDYGMLFVFKEDGDYGFWMKDTLVPLDIFWLDAQGQVVTIASDVSPASYPHVFYSSRPARYVLETSAGFARRYAIATGTPLHLQNFPTVSE